MLEWLFPLNIKIQSVHLLIIKTKAINHVTLAQFTYQAASRVDASRKVFYVAVFMWTWWRWWLITIVVYHNLPGILQ